MPDMLTMPAPAIAPAPTASGKFDAPQFDARMMTAGGNTAEIMLDDNTYTLRITKSGRLILTK